MKSFLANTLELMLHQWALFFRRQFPWLWSHAPARGQSGLATTAFLFRTNRITPLLEHNLQKFTQAFPGRVFVVADVSEQPPDAPSALNAQNVSDALGTLACECIPIDLAWAEGAGLATYMHRPLHLNGDYFYYRAAQALPQFDHFWLMDDDVYLHANHLREFFEGMSTVQADFLGAHFIRRPWFWGWTRRARVFFKSPARCFFPVSRLSRRAIEILLVERRRQSTLNLGNGWINDEAFVAGCVVDRGLAALDMNEIASVYTWTGLNWKGRHSLKSLLKRRPDQRFYHSVKA